jgi:hypothetical protein
LFSQSVRGRAIIHGRFLPLAFDAPHYRDSSKGSHFASRKRIFRGKSGIVRDSARHGAWHLTVFHAKFADSGGI